jgi:hypothetical protein
MKEMPKPFFIISMWSIAGRNTTNKPRIIMLVQARAVRRCGLLIVFILLSIGLVLVNDVFRF